MNAVDLLQPNQCIIRLGRQEAYRKSGHGG